MRVGEVIKTILECWSRVPFWNPLLVLYGAPLPSDSSIWDFDNGSSGYVANAVEQALLLPRDMTMLWNLKKHEMFLSLKRDLALVYSHPFFLAHTHTHTHTCLSEKRRRPSVMSPIRLGPVREEAKRDSCQTSWVWQSSEKCQGIHRKLWEKSPRVASSSERS